MKDYYYILGLKKEASSEDIKKAYRKLSLKFHPDKNGGDDFFTDRFKEIQEAYQTLSNISLRAIYDNQFSDRYDTNKTTSGFNFNPVVDFFNVNKTSFEYDEEITFTWRTINSDKVFIKPFGDVKPIGQKTYKIKDFKNPTLTVEIVAENSNIGRKVNQSITIENRTFKELYFHFKNLIENEKTFTHQNKGEANEDRNGTDKKTYVQHKTDKGIVEIEPCIRFKGKKAFMNGKPAPDGKYKFGFLWYVIVKDGVVIKE